LAALLVAMLGKVLVVDRAKRHQVVVGCQHTVLFAAIRRRIQLAVLPAQIFVGLLLRNTPIGHLLQLGEVRRQLVQFVRFG